MVRIKKVMSVIEVFGTCQRKQMEIQQLMQRLVYKQQTHKGSFPWRLQPWTIRPFQHTQTEQTTLQHKVCFSPQWPHTPTKRSSFCATYEWPGTKETCSIYRDFGVNMTCWLYAFVIGNVLYIFWHQSGMN